MYFWRKLGTIRTQLNDTLYCFFRVIRAIRGLIFCSRSRLKNHEVLQFIYYVKCVAKTLTT